MSQVMSGSIPEQRRKALRGMLRERVAIVRKCFDVWRTDHFESLAHHIDAAVRIDWSESIAPYRGVYCGHAGWRQLFGEIRAPFTEVSSEAHEFVFAGQHVAVPNTARMRSRDGVEVIARSTVVFTFRGVKLVELRLFQCAGEALEAIGAA